MWSKCSTSNLVDNQSVHFNVLSKSQLDRLFAAVLEVLERTGAEIHNEEALGLLKKAGCWVDGKRVRFPSRLVEKAISTAPSRVVLSDRNGNRRLFLEGNNTYFGPGPTNPHFIDLETGERRKVLKQDVCNVARLVEDLPNLDFCMSLASISDVTESLADVHEVHAMLQNTTKPFVTWAFNRKNVETIVSLCEEVAGGAEALQRNPFIVLYAEPCTPLKHPEDSLDKMLYMAEKGLPVMYTPGVQGNATAPASLAGVIVVAAADNLAGLVIHQLKNEGAPYIAGGVTTNMDMKTMIHCYGSSPEFCLMHAGYTEFVHYLNLPMFSTAGCSDSKVLDEQAAIEYALSIYSAALSGANLVHDVGFLESGMSASLEGLVMADEIIGYVRTILKGIKVDDESLALDVIDKVGPGGHFLGEEHTFNNYKNFWNPSLISRERYQMWEEKGKTTFGERANKKAKKMLENHEPQCLTDAVLNRLHSIVDEAEKSYQK
ncbi:MAG: trimethylamine methyltransferase family protein [Clostridia bacterium]|nr:trimethylamine methyltransferase family protein [Clostridia bacterium]